MNVQDYSVFYNNCLRPVIYEGWHFILVCEKHFHDRIISLIGDVWTHKISLTPPLFMDIHVLSQKSEWSCICVLGASILFLRFQNGFHRVLRFLSPIKHLHDITEILLKVALNSITPSPIPSHDDCFDSVVYSAFRF